MKLNLKRLSVFVTLLILLQVSKADSFLLSEDNEDNVLYVQSNYEINKDHIIPIIYVKNIEYYNQTKSDAYTSFITDYLALEPSIIITDNDTVADFDLIPKLLESKMEPLNDENVRYNMSICVELWARGGVKVAFAEKKRYIVVKKTQNIQVVAHQLLEKLLQEALNSLILKIKNNQLQTI